jgi:hypothetical protein
MEVVIDWVIKMAFRNQYFKTWMRSNVQQWDHLIHWVKDNTEVPQNFMGYGSTSNSTLKLCKRSRDSTQSGYRYDKRKNQVLNFYRKSSLITIKMGQEVPDTSGEIDID